VPRFSDLLSVIRSRVTRVFIKYGCCGPTHSRRMALRAAPWVLEGKSMLQIHLRGRREYQPDEDLAFLPRDFNGWTRGMAAEQVYTSARGWWRLSRVRAERERYAVVEAEGECRMAIEITCWETHPESGRHAFEGIILQPGHRVHDRYVGRPMSPASQNPIHYFTDAGS